MTSWRRRARLLVALFAVVFAVFVAMAFRDRPAEPEPVSPERSDPSAVVESRGGTQTRYTLEHQDGSVSYDHLFTYADGSTRMAGVTIVAPNRGGRTYTVKANQADVGKDESSMILTGTVTIGSSDGLTAETEQAIYTESNGVVRAPGSVRFRRGRLEGTGLGMTYDTSTDVLTILENADLHVAAGADGGGRVDLAAGRLTFPRAAHVMRLERGANIRRDDRVIAADDATVHLGEDDERLMRLELRGHSTVTAEAAAEGGLQSLAGRDIDLHYGEDGEAIERAQVEGGGVIQLASAGGRAGRRIQANRLDVALAPDGATPVDLAGRTAVQLSIPADGGMPARRIDADELVATGEPGRGLTDARFTGHVMYREQSATERTASSSVLDVALAPGSGAIEDARFSRGVRFVQGAMEAHAASARYRVGAGVVELTGTEPTTPVPSVVNDQIDVRAVRIDVTLEGPHLHATSDVKSVIRPSAGTGADRRTRLPALLKEDEPVTVTGDELKYDGERSRAVYTGRAWLWQGDTSVKGDTLTLDSATGDLSASGSVTSTTVLDETDDDGKAARVTTVATSKAFAYDDKTRRATYTDDAHVSGPSRDMTATRIEMYLAESGDRLERVEAYESVTLRERQRTTKGSRMTYTAADERYVVTGAPATVVDECRRETTGQRIAFLRASDTIAVDGGTQRATTRGGNCEEP